MSTSDILSVLDERRTSLGLTQTALARELEITQPHYSKVVGRIVPLAPSLQARMEDWLEKSPSPKFAPGEMSEISRLIKSIEMQSRQLSVLLTHSGEVRSRRRQRKLKA